MAISNETRLKMRLAKLGKKRPEYVCRKMSETRKRLGIKPPSWKGKHHSEETKKKMSLNNNVFLNGHTPWNKGISPNVETRIKIGLGNKGKIISKECKEKMSDAQKRIGNKPPVFRGEKHYRYIKDRSKIKHLDKRHNPENEIWKKKCKKRDGHKCKMENEECRGQLEVHHILEWAKFPELRYDINNGITLCHFHHPRKKTEVERLSPYFKSLINML